MDWFKNMKIQSKLIFVFGIIAIFIVILVGMTIITTDKIEESFINLMDGPQQRAGYALDADRELSNMMRDVLHMIYTAEDIKEVEQYYEYFYESEENFLENLSFYFQNLENDIYLSKNEREKQKKDLKKIQDLFLENYKTYIEAMFQAVVNEDLETVNTLLKDGIFLRDEISGILWKLNLAAQKNAINIKTETQTYSHESRIKVILISTFITPLVFFVLISMSRIIKEPIIRIESAVREVSKGNLNYPIRSIYKDEIGMLSNHIGNMIDIISMQNKSVSIVDNLDDMIFVTDFNYNLIYYSRKVAETFGIEKEPTSNLKCYKIMNGSNSPCSFCQLSDFDLEKESFPSEEWERQFLIDGKEQWYLCKSSITRWVDGSLVQFCACKDDTARRERERAQAAEYENTKIRAGQKSLQTVLDALPIPVRIVDLESNDIVYVNESLAELLEYDSPREVCGLKLKDILPEAANDGTPSSKLIHMTVNSENLISFEVDYKTKYGKIIESLLSTRHIEYKGRRSSIGIIKDLTIEKERARILENAAEQEREANQMKSQFLANMSHEIRTPMNGIIGFSELALDDDISNKTRDYLVKIKASSEGLLQIINDILDISKIESGKMELEHIPIDIGEVFKLCRNISMPKALEKGITLFCYAEPSVNRTLIGDPTRLRQILLNLLSNAVKFTNTGMVKLLAAIVETTETTITMHFEVKDNGIGMSSEQMENVFLPFEQGDNSITRKYGGTGLGLAITKNIVELMGGQLKVESALGLGSIFSFDLTFETLDKPTEIFSKPAETLIFEKPQFEGEILICEDNELNQQVISEHLSRVGLKAVIACNGKIGLDYVKKRIEKKEKPFDLIFMDVHMPVMDGLETAQKIVELGNVKPIVALTANIMSDDIKRYQEAGMCDCVPKPFSTNELWSCLLKYLTPVHMTLFNETEQSMEDEKWKDKMISSFVKNNQKIYEEIENAIQTGDIERAHRIAHTLKGVAGTLDMKKLQKAAYVIEQSLSGGKVEFTDEQMKTLALELDTVLAEFTSSENKNKNQTYKMMDKTKVSTSLEKLSSLLDSDSFDCLTMVDELKKIEGTQRLIDSLERFDFKTAREILVNIKAELGCDNE